MGVQKTKKGIKRCAEFLSKCLEIGWSKSELVALESLFWKYRDKNGDLKTRKPTKPQPNAK